MRWKLRPICLLSERISEEHKKIAILYIFARTLWKISGFASRRLAKTLAYSFFHPCPGNGQVRVRTVGP